MSNDSTNFFRCNEKLYSPTINNYQKTPFRSFLVADIKAVQQALKLMENKTLLQKIKYLLDNLVDDLIVRLDKNLPNQDEQATKEKVEIANLLIKITPIAIKVVNILDEEPVRGDFELTPEQIEEFQKFIKKYEAK